MDSPKMDSQQTFSLLIERLDYSTSSNLISRETPNEKIPAELDVTWREGKEKLQVDAIYFVANAPIIYFKRFETYNTEAIADFHSKVWNQSWVPLIFVILPNDIRIYNGYEPPQRSFRDRLVEPPRLDNLFSYPDDLWKRLEIFSRIAIESGNFWRDYGHYFSRETRADQKLIANLRYIRRQLIREAGLNPEHTHSLIGRSIFAFYLQDRGVLPVGEDGFFAQTFNGLYTRYTDLLTSYEDTYTFFEILHEHFNGDMFPVTLEEKNAVNSTHLKLLHELFTVDSTVGGQMLFFWAYNFEFIPLELISSIYEEFLHQEESGRNGAYYTPPMLVNFMLDQVLSWNEPNYNIGILDPACGSGIFLVEAYRRLIECWANFYQRKPSPNELAEILQGSLFGVDIKRQALRVAAFSLYLTMLDHIEPKTIWREVRFPSLLGTNLIEADFFEDHVEFGDRKFNIVIGNPPWESQLTDYAQAYLDKYHYKVGDKQIAQAFLLHAPDLCALDGQIALLCSSKSLLFNKSSTNLAFRQTFFRRYSVTKIFDFSALRRFLFEKGIAPATAIFYRPQSPTRTTTIFYGAPKLTHLARRFAGIVIEANDLKQIPLWQILSSMDNIGKRHTKETAKQKSLFANEEDEEDEISSNSHFVNIWKVALWGTDYDYTLLRALNSYPSLKEIIKSRGWFGPRGGFNLTGPGELKHFEWLDKAQYLDAEDFTRYVIDESRLQVLPKENRYYRGGAQKLFTAPFVLFKRGQEQRRPSAAFSSVSFAYTTAITGIAGPENDRDLLKVLTALLNSELAQYFWFLTSSSWGVEREEITVGELKTLPFPFLDVSKEKISTIAILVDRIANYIFSIAQYKTRTPSKTLTSMFEADAQIQISFLEQELNRHIYECFHLDEQEIQLIHETVQYTIDFFHNPEDSPSLQRPTIEAQRSYAQSYINSINFYLEPVGRKLIATVFDDEIAPLITVQFTSRMLNEEVPDIQVSSPDDHMRQALLDLHKLSNEQLSSRLYLRRNFRIYDKVKNTLSILKPAELRFWTTGAALSDAEETVSELLQPMKV